MNKIIVAAGIAAVAGTASANQLFSTETENFVGTGGLATPLTFDQYNGSLTLTGVKITLTLNVDGGTITLDNDGPGSANAAAEFGASGSISSSDVNLNDTNFNPIGAGLNVVSIDVNTTLSADDGDAQGEVNDGGPDSITEAGANATDMDMGFVNSFFFGDYTGNGTFDIDVVTSTLFNTNGSGSGVGGSFLPPNVSGSVTVEYFVIPAPGAAALLGLGGLIAARRRR